MEINIGQNQGAPQGGGIQSRGGKIPQGATVIAKNLIKKSVTIDKDGNHIDLATKTIIKRREQDTPANG